PATIARNCTWSTWRAWPSAWPTPNFASACARPATWCSCAGCCCPRPRRIAPPEPMNQSLSASELFAQQHDRLGLRWVAGQAGQSRLLESVETNARRPSLAGYLNIIYPNKVQILGTEELAWLDGLDSRLRWETIERVMQYRPLALVVSKGQSCPEDLREA